MSEGQPRPLAEDPRSALTGAAEVLLAASPDAVVVIDAGGAIVLANPAVEGLFGYPPGELVGQPVEVLLPPELREGHVATRTAYAAHPRTRPMGAGLRLVGRRRDGGQIPIDVALAPLPGAIPLFGAFIRDATEQRRAEDRLERLSMVEERDRIARDLHDTVIQRLFATGMSLAALQRQTVEPVSARISQAVEELDDTIRQIRSTIFELQQPPGGGGGVRRQVQDVVADAASTMTAPPRVAFDGPVDTMVPTEVTTHLLAVVREALANTARHAQARAVEVVVSLEGSDLVLVVTDDGVGPPEGPTAGNGLRNMASRAEGLGGRFTLTARRPKGTTLEWRVPIR